LRNRLQIAAITPRLTCVPAVSVLAIVGLETLISAANCA
jgi:hypothetical protein